MLLTRNQLIKIIREGLYPGRKNPERKDATSSGRRTGIGIARTRREEEEIDLKRTKIFILQTKAEGKGVSDGLAADQTPILGDFFSQALGAKRVMTAGPMSNITKFIKDKGLDAGDLDADTDGFEISEFLGIPVVDSKFLRSPGYRKDRLMRYQIAIIHPNGEVIAVNNTLDVSSDARSKSQILEGVEKLCKTAGLK